MIEYNELLLIVQSNYAMCLGHVALTAVSLHTFFCFVLQWYFAALEDTISKIALRQLMF